MWYKFLPGYSWDNSWVSHEVKRKDKETIEDEEKDPPSKKDKVDDSEEEEEEEEEKPRKEKNGIIMRVRDSADSLKTK